MNKNDWRDISSKVRSVNKCCICNTATSVLDTHELYSYDTDTKIIKLEKLLPVCHDCHNTIHIGRMRVLMAQGLFSPLEIPRLKKRCIKLFGQYEEDITFFMEVNDVEGWKLDMSLLGRTDLIEL